MSPPRSLCALVIALVAAIALVAPSVREARADVCYISVGALSPPSKTELSPRGVIYLFLYMQSASLRKDAALSEATLAKQLAVKGATFTAHIASQTRFVSAVRIEYQASAPELSVRWQGRDWRMSATYPIGELARPRTTVVAVEPKQTRVSCLSRSTTLGIAFESNAIAYRLAWDDGSSQLLPPNALAPKTPAEAQLHQLHLGQVGCQGHSVPPEQLATERAFLLSALYADGSERVFPPARAMLRARGDLRLPLELIEVPVTVELRGPAGIGRSLALLGAALISALALLLLRRRWYRSALHSPH